MLVRHRLEEQYANLEQQNETAALGMWLFLATEIMFFGTLFTAAGRLSRALSGGVRAGQQPT